MSLRVFLKVLSSGLLDHNNESTHEEINVTGNAGVENYENIVIDFQTPAKFHIGMLSISLIVGIAYGGYTAYTCWMKQNIFLGYIRNLVIALLCRTFFSIVFDGAILLGSPLNVGGGNSLLSFEQICLNLVIAFWLTLNIYLHERVQRNFNNEPTLIIYQYGVPGIALFFAFLWIFTLQGQWPTIIWWVFINPFTQWIVNSINLLYLLIQLALLANIVRAMMKITLDNDSVSLLRKISVMMGILVLIFWLQFGLSIGRVPFKTPQSHLYFYYFIDGLECAIICLVLFFFNKWVVMLLNKVSSLMARIEGLTRTPVPSEVLLSDGQGIVTIDSVFMTRESGKWKSSGEEGNKDVVYSNVIEPERLKKTLELYKRLNIIPTSQVTTVEGEEFYDCQLPSPLVPEYTNKNLFLEDSGKLTFNVSKSKTLKEKKNLENIKVTEKKQNKNAFYSSKYLILDSKEHDIPSYLETRPSVSSASGKDSFKSEKRNKDMSSDFNVLRTDELVHKWLNDNSENLQNKDKNRMASPKITEIEKPKMSYDKDSSSEMLSQNFELHAEKIVPKKNKNQNGSQQTVFSTINSAFTNFIFGSSKDEEKEILSDSGGTKNLIDSKPFKDYRTEPDEKKIANYNISNTEKEQVTTTIPMPSDMNTDFTPTALRNKHELKINIEDNERPQETTKKVTYKVQQVNENQHQVDENILQDIKNKEVIPSEYPNESNYIPVLSEPEKFLALTNTERQQQQNQLKNSVLLSSYEENLISNDEPSEFISSELCESSSLPKELLKKQQTYSNADQIETEFREIRNNKSRTPKNYSEIQQALNSEVRGVEFSEQTDDRTLEQSVHSSKFEIELPVQSGSSGPVELRNDLSFSDVLTEVRTTAETKDRSEPNLELENPLNQFITYSDLLEFRLQRDKLTNTQPKGVSKKLFDFSEAFSFAIGSLVSASSRFFTTIKHLPEAEKEQEAVILKYEGNEHFQNKNLEVAQNEEISKLILDEIDVVQRKSMDITSSEFISTSHITKNYSEPQSLNSSTEKQNFTLQTHALEFQNKTAEVRNNEYVVGQSPHDSRFSSKFCLLPEVQKDQTTMNSETFENATSSNLQKQLDYNKKEKKLKVKKKIQKRRTRTQVNNNKPFKNFNEKSVNKMDSYPPLNKKKAGKHQKKLFENHGRPVKKPKVIETSSDSEFSIERKKESSASDSFSVDQYYAQLIKNNEKFYNQSNFVYGQQEKTRNF